MTSLTRLCVYAAMQTLVFRCFLADKYFFVPYGNSLTVWHEEY